MIKRPLPTIRGAFRELPCLHLSVCLQFPEWNIHERLNALNPPPPLTKSHIRVYPFKCLYEAVAQMIMTISPVNCSLSVDCYRPFLVFICGNVSIICMALRSIEGACRLSHALTEFSYSFFFAGMFSCRRESRGVFYVLKFMEFVKLVGCSSLVDK